MKRLFLLLAGLLLFASAEETLRLKAEPGREVALLNTTKTEMQQLDYFWPPSLPKPVTNPTVFARTNRGTVRYRVTAPGEVEIVYQGKLPNIKKPLEIRYRLRYRGARVELVDPERTLAEIAQKLGIDPEQKGALKELLSGLPGFGEANLIPEFTVPLRPGAKNVVYVPYLEGKTAETEVIYLGMKDGLHRFRLRTRFPYVELEQFKKLLPPGSLSKIALGPGYLEGESAYYPDGLPAGSASTLESLSFTYLKSGELQFLMAAKLKVLSESKLLKSK